MRSRSRRRSPSRRRRRARRSLPPGLPVIRDAEIEQLLRDYTQPILRAAGLAQQNIQVTIINDRSFNAFVVDAKHIFINAGALMDAKMPNEVIGVLAHETGHIAGGHLSRLRQSLHRRRRPRSSPCCSASAARSPPGAAAAISAIRPLPFSARRRPSGVRCCPTSAPQEEQADRGGVKFLTATGQSAKGMYDTFKRLSDQILFAAQNADPYLQSHPMPAERVAALEVIARTSPDWDKKDPPELQLRHDLMRAKLTGFLDAATRSPAAIPSSDTSLPARYARAICDLSARRPAQRARRRSTG